jgi:glucose/mannose transport system permease protein
MSTVPATMERPATEKNGRGGRILMYIVLAVFAVVFLVPVYVAIVTSLKGTQEVATGGIWDLPINPTFANFTRRSTRCRAASATACC